MYMRACGPTTAEGISVAIGPGLGRNLKEIMSRIRAHKVELTNKPPTFSSQVISIIDFPIRSSNVSKMMNLRLI